MRTAGENRWQRSGFDLQVRMAMRRKHVFLIAILIHCVVGGLHAAEDRNAIVRSDRDRVQEAGFWVYNDLEKGIAEASATRKPMLVVFRCVP